MVVGFIFITPSNYRKISFAFIFIASVFWPSAKKEIPEKLTFPTSAYNLIKDHHVVDYSPADLKFRSTFTQRAERSQFFFATGLFDRRVALSDVEYEEPVRSGGDPVLRAYVSCDKWVQEVKLNPQAAAAKWKCFENTEAFRKVVIDGVNADLGFSDLTVGKLTLDDIEAMHLACSFGQA